MNTTCLVHIVDDDAAVRTACAFLMEALGHAHQTWEHGQAFLDQADCHRPAVALIDLRMPFASGAEVVSQLQQRHSTIAPLILTGHGDVPTAVAMLKQGVVDFLQKPIQAEPLQAAIQQAWQHALKLQQLYTWRGCEHSLTPKEQHIVQLMVQGMTNKDMAETLHVSQRTIEVHRANAMAKFQCEHLAQLVHIYWQLHPQ